MTRDGNWRRLAEKIQTSTIVASKPWLPARLRYARFVIHSDRDEISHAGSSILIGQMEAELPGGDGRKISQGSMAYGASGGEFAPFPIHFRHQFVALLEAGPTAWIIEAGTVDGNGLKSIDVQPGRFLVFGCTPPAPFGAVDRIFRFVFRLGRAGADLRADSGNCLDDGLFQEIEDDDRVC